MICWKTLTRSMTSAASSASVPSASLNSLSAGFDQTGVFDLLLLQAASAPRFLYFSCSSRRLTSSSRGFFFGAGGRVWVARQQHLRLDVDKQRRGVDELGGHVYVELLHALDVLQELRRDLGDRDIVDVDVLLADEVEQQSSGPS